MGSPSLGTTPRNIDLARGSIASSLAICRVSISVVVDDVEVLVDFQHGLELGVDYDVHGVQQRVAEMQFYAQVAILYQMEAGTVALVGGQVETEEGVAVSVVAASQSVPLVLPHLTGRGEQTHVAPDEEVVCEIGLERFGGYLSSVHVHRVEVDVVVLGVKRILGVHAVVGIVIDAQHQTFRQGTEEQVLVRVRPSASRNGVHLALDGSHRILDRALLQSLDVRHLHGRIQGGLHCKQGGIDDLYFVIRVEPTSHECKSRLTTNQSYLDIDAVDQEFILQKEIHVETAHRIDQATPYDVLSSSHEPFVSRGSVGYLDGVHASGRVLVPQLTRQLRVLGIGTVAQQRLYVGAIRIRVGRRGHERAVQIDVDLTEQRMQPVIDRRHGVGQVEIVLVGSFHLRLHVQHRVGEIQVIVARPGYEELYRSTRVQRGHGLMFHYVTVDYAVLSGGYGKEIQFGLDPFARLSMYESHRRYRICRLHVSWTSVSCVVSLLK